MIKRFFVSLLLVIFTVIIIQGLPLYNLWGHSSHIIEGQTRAEVISFMGKPSHEWAKASNLDVWVGKLLLGGVKIDISYQGEGCSWESRVNSQLHCKVVGIRKVYFTLWGNHWFLAYASTYT